MRKFVQAIFVLTLVLTSFSSPQAAQAESAVHAPDFSTASELISAVNDLRATYGLAPYQANSILMSIAQAQAEYIMYIQTGTHLDANGYYPYQRALTAGYPVAGDLSLGGFFSENLVGGAGLDAAGAVEKWMGDDPHKITMLSTNLRDVGAGVAVSGNTYYYVLDCGLSTGGTPRPFTPPPSYSTPVATLIPNTPNADGSIIYIVQPFDTPLAIAIAYGVSLSEIYALNNLTDSSLIYPDQKIIVRAAYTPIPTQPTGTPTERPTITPWPTSLPTSTATSIPATPTPSPGMPVSRAGSVVITIIAAAIVIAGLITLLGRKRKV
jgi:uncharacterized protein YkwD/LysM repeat protein